MSPRSQHLLVVADTAPTRDLHDAVLSFAADPGARVRLLVLATGEEPIGAMQDALATFPATELLIQTRSPSLVERALATFGLPTVHVAAETPDPAAAWVAAAA